MLSGGNVCRRNDDIIILNIFFYSLCQYNSTMGGFSLGEIDLFLFIFFFYNEHKAKYNDILLMTMHKISLNNLSIK